MEIVPGISGSGNGLIIIESKLLNLRNGEINILLILCLRLLIQPLHPKYMTARNQFTADSAMALYCTFLVIMLFGAASQPGQSVPLSFYHSNYHEVKQ